MALTEYKRKRHFTRTPEPAPKTVATPGWSYVIQKHAASHLHYDFRLELDGVLKSWAVPKGPSLDPSVKRLAMHVEDHPVAYGGFEGTIPAGEYGGGTVMLWDRGTWEPIGDPRAGYKAGKLKFIVHGEKLQGAWMLVRTHRPGTSGEPWLLFKERDDEAKPTSEGDILEEEPLSVASERDLDEIAAAKGKVWSSNRSANGKPAAATKRSITAKKTKSKPAKPSRSTKRAAVVVQGKKAPMPETVEVQLATLTEKPPTGDEWLHEIKFDGYRMICRIDGPRVKFISRNQQEWTDRLSPLVLKVKQLPVKQAILDGEIVVMNEDGTTDFQSLQNAFREGRVGDLKYYVFDLLYLDGQSLMELPLEQRKQHLQELLASNTEEAIRYSEHVNGSGAEFEKQACRLHLEGIICKRRDQPYQPGRGYDWLKVKCTHEDEFVIGGFTEPSGARTGFGALLVGFHDSQGKLHYAGKVGTGFNDANLKSLTERLKSMEQPKSPFVDLQRKVGDVRTAHWIEPSLVGQFKFGSITREGKLRHASFQGLREDKSAEDVKMDQPVPVETAVKKSGKTATKTSRTRSKSTGKTVKRTRASKPDTNSDGDGADQSEKDTFAGVRLTHPDKVLYPEDGITKLDLAKYYQEVADWILPHLAHRPLVLVRCPDGQKQECFYQKHPGVGTPKTLRQIPIQEKTRKDNYLIVDDLAGLISLAQVGALELHAWGSREDKLEYPDRLIFDLDPAPDVLWKTVVDSARQIREFLQELGLESFLKTTGGKGLHLVVPIDRRHEWDEAKSFCKQVADTIVSAAPQSFTANMSKAARPGKIFVDYLRNGRGATAVVPYSTRARAGATVSTPLAWDELSVRIKSDSFTIRNVPSRLQSLKADPWEGIASVRQSLTGPIKKLQALAKSG